MPPPPPPPPNVQDSGASTLKLASADEEEKEKLHISRYDSAKGPELPPFQNNETATDAPDLVLKCPSFGHEPGVAPDEPEIRRSRASADATAAPDMEGNRRYLLAPPLFISAFPPETQLSIAQTITKALSASTAAGTVASMVPTPGHLQWALQCVGGIFSLQNFVGESLQMVHKALIMFQTWLLADDPKHVAPHVWRVSADVEDVDGERIDQQFLVAMCKHMCLLFNERPSLAPERRKTYVALCMLVLDTFLALVTKCGDRLTERTWGAIIRCLLRAGKAVLLGAKKRSVLVDAIPSETVRVILEIFLRSHTKDKALWNGLTRLLQRALYDAQQAAVARQWREMMLGLTRRLLDVLWPTQGDSAVMVDWVTRRKISSNVPLPLKDKYLCSVWRKLLDILDEPFGISAGVEMGHHFSFHERSISPYIYLLRVQYLGDVLDLFLNLRVVVDSQRTQAPPEPNTILELFGDQLFAAATNLDPGCAHGRAAAICVLGRLLQSRSIRGKEMSAGNFARYHHCLNLLLDQRPTGASVCAMLLSWDGVFAGTLKGARRMVPHYTRVAAAIMRTKCSAAVVNYSIEGQGLAKLDESVGAALSQDPVKIFYLEHALGKYHAFGEPSTLVDAIRAAILSTLSSLLPVPNSFSWMEQRGLFFTSQTDHKVARVAADNDGNKRASMGIKHASAKRSSAARPEGKSKAETISDDFRQMIGKLLIDSMLVETNDKNAQTLLWLLCAKVLEDQHVSPGIAQITVAHITNILTRWKGAEAGVTEGELPAIHAPTRGVVLTAIGVLKELSSMDEIIDRASSATIPNMIKKLCAFAVRARAHSDLLCSAAFMCLHDWILLSPAVVLQERCSREVIRAASAGLESAGSHPMRHPRVQSGTSSARAQAKILTHLLRTCGTMRDPYRGGSGSATHAVNERNIDGAVSAGFSSSKFSPNFHFCVSDGGSRLVTLIEFPSEDTRMQEVVSVRSSISLHADGKSSATREKLFGIIVRDEHGKNVWLGRQMKTKAEWDPQLEIAALASPDSMRGNARLSSRKYSSMHVSEAEEKATFSDPLLDLKRQMEGERRESARAASPQSAQGQDSLDDLKDWFERVHERATRAAYECDAHRSIRARLPFVKLSKKSREALKKRRTSSESVIENFEACRQFLWESSFAGLHSWGNASHVKATPALLDELEALDAVSPRETISVHTAFCGNQFDASNWSSDFRAFLEAAGRGEPSSFERSCAGEVMRVAHAAPSEDVEFVVSRDLSLVSDDDVHFVLIWNDSETPFCYKNDAMMKTICGLSPSGWTFLLVVEPTDAEGLYRVRCQRNKQRLGPARLASSIGPLLDKCVVGRHLLLTMIVNTIRCAKQRLPEDVLGAARAGTGRRKEMIAKIANKYGELSSDFFGGMFGESVETALPV